MSVNEHVHLVEMWQGISSYMTVRDIGLMEMASKDYWENHAAYAYSCRRLDKEVRYLTYQERFHVNSGKPLTDKEHCVDVLKGGRGILCYGGGYGFGEATPNVIFDIKEGAEEHLRAYDDKQMHLRGDDEGEVEVEVEDTTLLLPPVLCKSIFDMECLYAFNPPKLLLADSHYSCSARTLDAFGNIWSLGGMVQVVDEESATNLTHITHIRHKEGARTSRHSRCTFGAPLPIESCYGAAVTLKKGDILYTGGGATPFRGSEVFSACYVKPFQYSNLFEKPSRLYPKHTAQVVTHKFHENEMQSDSWTDILAAHEYRPQQPLHGFDRFYTSSKEIGSAAEADDASAWSTEIPNMLERRCGHCLVATFDDHVVALGGYSGGENYLNSTEYLDTSNPGTGWQRGPAMHDRRSGAAAVMGPDGRILVAGGSVDGEIPLNSAEAMDHREGKWVKLASMKHKRGYCAGVMAPRERFLVSGGICTATYKCSDGLESYDTRADRWALLNDSRRGTSQGKEGTEREWDDDYPAVLHDAFYRSCHAMFMLPSVHYD